MTAGRTFWSSKPREHQSLSWQGHALHSGNLALRPWAAARFKLGLAAKIFMLLSVLIHNTFTGSEPDVACAHEVDGCHGQRGKQWHVGGLFRPLMRPLAARMMTKRHV